jgi:hypothetical protein
MKKAFVLICLLVILAPAAVLAGCGSGTDTQESDVGSPEQVARSFWEASMTGDADTSWNLLSEELQSGLKNKEAWAQSGVSDTLGDNTIEVGKAKITGDTAEVTIRIMNGNAEITDSDVLLVKENGEWKVKLP